MVTVHGHTTNSDEWHPQGLATYGGPSAAAYYPSSSWIDHLVIHDDNFGPYWSLTRAALPVQPNTNHSPPTTNMAGLAPRWVLGVVPPDVVVHPLIAEAMATTWLSEVGVSLFKFLARFQKSRWLRHMAGGGGSYVLRTVLVDRGAYVEHLKGAHGHDGSKLRRSEMKLFASLPERFLMSEISYPDLFTGNKTKLGEIIVDAAYSTREPNEAIVAARCSGFLVVAAGGQVLAEKREYNYTLYPLSLIEHSRLYRVTQIQHEW